MPESFAAAVNTTVGALTTNVPAWVVVVFPILALFIGLRISVKLIRKFAKA